MKLEKITAAVFMAISTVGIAAATAHAEPVVTEQPAAVIAGDATSGSDHGVNYQHVGADDRTLTSTPADIAQLEDISSYDRLKEQIDKNLPGVVGGAIVGGLLGACMPLIWGVSVPVGVLIGGTVGGYVVGGPEFLDAVQAFIATQGR
ncbi:hypothetical protein [Nocardia implantans]|uniref:Secreted protein n=1 Tax=Nocardia implantans TaxID=3108168 RepID=A0ABU6AMW2_9NOCA|nr:MULTISPECIES: hypothetical protein [unclassified Nocardia]MBF6193591.1 hypothetical protein [Nocardia beijingensis]MEA3532200.1 hypothetical protein [Nocardia sp. CDC192]MEB3508691.1 hypothetical protein [Nocardia sp. CDC186]